MAKFVLNKAGYDEVVRSPGGIFGQHLLKLGKRVERLAKIQVGKKTHELKKSINTSMRLKGRNLVVAIGSNNKIALLHHKGARPHIIVPKKARTLRFYSRGRIVYTTLVRHPGTKPNRYLTDNLEKVVR